MNSYERIEAVFNGEIPDKLPVYDLIRNDKVIEHYTGEKLNFDNCQELVLKAVFHSDGYIMDIIPDLIKAGIDGLNPIEKAAGMDIRKIKSLYGDKIVLIGGMDVTELLSRGSKDEVKKATVEMIKDIAPGGRFLIGSTTELGNDIPVENIIAMIETINERGYY